MNIDKKIEQIIIANSHFDEPTFFEGQKYEGEYIIPESQLTAIIEEIKGIFIKKTRSLSQNSLYWVWLTCIESETGNDKDNLHWFFKHKFLGYADLQINTKKTIEFIKVIKSTTDLNTNQFNEYLTKIHSFCATELNITLLYPEDKNFLDFYNTYAC